MAQCPSLRTLVNLTYLHSNRRGNVKNRNNCPVNIRFVDKTSDIRISLEISDLMLKHQKWQYCAQSFTLWQQATIEVTQRDHSVSACSRHVYMGVVLRSHPVLDFVLHPSLCVPERMPMDVLVRQRTFSIKKQRLTDSPSCIKTSRYTTLTLLLMWI